MAKAKKKTPAKTEPKVNGRPTLFDEKYCDDILKYFDKPFYKTVKKKVFKNGEETEVEYEAPASFPTFEGYARKLKTTHKTLLNWCDKNPNFLQAYAVCKGIQKEFLVEHGLLGGYNPGFSKFLAINVTDLKEQVSDLAKDIEGAIRLKYNLDNE